jgi:uncharacterized protein
VGDVVFGNFKWDATKAASNVRKHGVSFDTALGCFDDPNGLELRDRLHPDRFLLIASAHDDLLTIVYTERQQGAILRIISARHVTNHEKKLYQSQR